MIINHIHVTDSVIIKVTDTVATIVPNSTTCILQLWINFEGWQVVQFSGCPQIVISTFEGKIIFISLLNNVK